MRIQIFSAFHPSEHLKLTVFGVTLFEFEVSKWYEERMIVLALLGVKLQVTFYRGSK